MYNSLNMSSRIVDSTPVRSDDLCASSSLQPAKTAREMTFGCLALAVLGSTAATGGQTA